MIAFTLAGGLSSALVGGAAGVIGSQLSPGAARVLLDALLVVGVLVVGREIGIVRWPLPQVGRQTQRMWAQQFPPAVASALWGFDIGLLFTTWFTFSGTWLVVAIALLTRSPILAAALFSAYWMGRALPVWLGPLLMADSNSAPDLVCAVGEKKSAFRRIHVLGSVWLMSFLLESAIRSTPTMS